MRRNTIVAAFAVAYVALAPLAALAFPDLVRHGYVNCTACHVSQTGGGALTPYGRSLSREVMSTWGEENETAWAYSWKNPPEWLIPGGDARGVYTYKNNTAYQEGKWIFMQTDLEAYYNWKDKFHVGGTFGVDDRLVGSNYVATGVSRRHFIDYRPSDTLSVRAGKFYPAFGINLPDHIISTKRGLGWDESTETYNLEAAYLGDTWNYYLTGVFGRPDNTSLIRDHGISATAAYAFLERYKVGASYFYGQRQGAYRHLIGPWGILGFTKQFYLLTETDFQIPGKGATGVTADQTQGLVTYDRLGYEIIQGLHVFFAEDISYLNVNNNSSRSWGHTIGSEWFPRPHLDFQVAWQKLLTSQYAGQYADFAWMQVHFYF